VVNDIASIFRVEMSQDGIVCQAFITVPVGCNFLSPFFLLFLFLFATFLSLSQVQILAQRLAILAEVFLGFPQSLQAHAGIVP
jgi:hypothetical protein